MSDNCQAKTKTRCLIRVQTAEHGWMNEKARESHTFLSGSPWKEIL